MKTHFTHKALEERIDRPTLPKTKLYTACGLVLSRRNPRLDYTKVIKNTTCLSCTATYEYKRAKSRKLKAGFQYEDGEAHVGATKKYIQFYVPDHKQTEHVLAMVKLAPMGVECKDSFRYVRRGDCWRIKRNCVTADVALKVAKQYNLHMNKDVRKSLTDDVERMNYAKAKASGKVEREEEVIWHTYEDFPDPKDLNELAELDFDNDEIIYDPDFANNNDHIFYP